jgi:hypothetical protein
MIQIDKVHLFHIITEKRLEWAGARTLNFSYGPRKLLSISIGIYNYLKRSIYQKRGPVFLYFRQIYILSRTFSSNLHFPVLSMNRFNQTEPATFSILRFWTFFRDSYFLYFNKATPVLILDYLRWSEALECTWWKSYCKA